MARISFVLFTALFAGSLALHQGPSPLVRIAENEGLKKLLHESAVRLAHAAKSTAFDGKIHGKYKTIGTKVHYYGNFRGKHIGNQLRGTYDIAMSGMHRMFGWNGFFRADTRGLFRIVTFGKYFRAMMEGKFKFRFLGKIDGKQATVTANGIFKLDVDSKGKFRVTDSGPFEAIIDGVKVIGTYNSQTNNSGFSTRMAGTIKGHKFNFLFKGTIEDLNKLVPMHIYAFARGTYGGKTFQYIYDPNGSGMINK